MSRRSAERRSAAAPPVAGARPGVRVSVLLAVREWHEDPWVTVLPAPSSDGSVLGWDQWDWTEPIPIVSHQPA